ncbi:MAG: AAA family ATPase [Chloroflexi bacterium]|nr:AAA family ATPase [Chloroflexota bacterium]
MTTNLMLPLAAYIPRDRVENMVQQRPLTRDGVAMIADISGFTPLTEALTQGLSADHGAEELTRALDSVFTPLIAQVHRYGGSVIKFGGDALIVWFGRVKRGRRTAVIRRALTAAGQMQKVMQRHGRIPTPIGPVSLQMKIGLAYGPVKRFNLGLPEIGFEDVLAGATLDRMADNEHHAEPGDIMADRETLAYAETAVTIIEWRDDVAVVGKILRPSRPQPWPELTWSPNKETDLVEQLAAYVPRSIAETLQTGQTQVAELKPVLSLFVQFHGLDYDADPEIETKLQTYFCLAQQVVARYGGRLNRLITGDKGSLLHIIFGAPRSVEEQELRAIRCALDLQADCGRLPFISMQRIGVTAGRVFAGPVGSPLRHDYTTMGDAINLSARLMQNAAADQILLDTAVRQQLNAAFTITDLGNIKVKGKANPIHVYAAESYQQPERVRRRIERLFGREAALSVIRNLLAVVRNRSTEYRTRNTKHGHILTIIGEVGQGKTLLLDNLRHEAEMEWQTSLSGGVWASGISLAYGNTFSGYLFIEILRDLLNVPPGATPHQTSQRLRDFCLDLFGSGRLDSTYPYLAKFMNLPLPEEAAARLDGLAGESLRWQIFELLPDLLRRVCAHYPVVLALDDLQWADSTSLQLLERLTLLTADSPLILLLAMRPEMETRAWEMALGWDTLALSNPEAAALPHTRLTLNALDDDAAVALITHHAPDLPERVVAYLVEKGGGNPLFLVELVRTLQLSDDTDFEDVALDALDLPNSVQGLLLAQLDRLAVEMRHMLQLAAVIGRTFLDEVLAGISTAEKQVTALISELADRDYVRPAQVDLGAAHTFRHALIQEGAYSTLLHERRRTYHRQVAQTFERLFPAAIAEQAAFLAYHYEHAADLDNAIYYLNQTADQARLLFAHEEAELLYKRILDLMAQDEGVDSYGRAKTYLKLAHIYSNQQAFSSAQEYYNLAFDLFDDHYEKRQDQPVAKTTFQEDTRTLKWGVIEQYVQTFDPAMTVSNENIFLVGNLFEGLMELDNEWNVIPALARRWRVDATGRHYQFELRADLKWSDGTSLTAHDFVFAYKRNLSPETRASNAGQLYIIEGAEQFHKGESLDAEVALGVAASDAFNLSITLNSPSHSFLYLLTDPVMFPQPAHQVKKFGDRWSKPENLVCNGAFMPIVKKNKAANLVQNPYYRGYELGNLEKVLFSFVHPNIDQYQNKHIDWCRVDDQANLIRQYPDEAILVQGFLTFFLIYSCHVPPFNDQTWRQIFAQCIHRQTLVSDVWSDVQRPAYGGLVPPGMPGHTPEISLAFNPTAARKTLESHLPKTQLPPSLRLITLPGFKETPQFLSQVWGDYLGVPVSIEENLAADDLISQFQEGKAHMALLGFHLDYPDPDELFRTLFHSASPLNFLGWQNARFDALLDGALTSANLSDRLSRYHQADQLLVTEDVVAVPLYYLQAYGLLRPHFHLMDSGKIVHDGAIKFKNIRAI